MADNYDGFLLACYADHPLTALLQSDVAPAPTTGIFEASVLVALDLVRPTAKFGIITTGAMYETQLGQGVKRIMKREGKDPRMFAGVAATGISPDRLRTESRDDIRRRVAQATRRLLKAGDLEVICVGGVILAGIEDYIRELCVSDLGAMKGSRVVVVDQMVAGVQNLVKSVQSSNTP